jgi:hypothetical protein
VIDNNIYCKASGMVMQCIADFQRENEGRLPVVCEIGCADGQGTMRYAGFTELVVAVDPMLPGRPDVWSANPSDDFKTFDQAKVDVFMARNREFPVRLVIGCSLWSETYQAVQSALEGKRIDVLLIDGCHHPYEAVRGDFDLYYPLVSKGGYVVLDDTYEECIQRVVDEAKAERGMVETDAFYVPPPALQKVVALRKTED